MNNNINNSGKKEINKQMIIIVVSVIATVLSTIGVTFAAFVWSDTSEKEQNVVVGNLNLTISEESTTLGENLDVPIPDEKVDELTPYTFTVTNTGGVDAYFKLKIADDTAVITSDSCTSNQIDKAYIGIKVTGGNNLTGLLSEYKDNPIDFGVLEPQESKTYKVYLWLKSNSPNNIIGKHYHGKIQLETEQTVDNEKQLATAILANEKENIKTEPPQFTDTSQDKGLYKLQDSDVSTASISSEDSETNKKGSIYYYRGAVENNYVQFGTYTKEVKNMIFNDSTEIEEQQTVAAKGTPILWRIVRINEDGSIKLIAEHNIGLKVVWNSNDTSNYEESDIKKTIDDWYKETFEITTEYPENKKLASLIKETELCNDRQELIDSSSAVQTRLNKENPAPTLKCSLEDTVTAKAGLISADEMVYAGALYNKSVTDNTTYLNNKTYFWTISPYSSSIAFDWYPINLEMLAYIVSNANFAAARPVITISANASVTTDFLSKDAPGTINNPYKVVIK